MSIETKLKDLILSRYKSLREFTIIVDIPYTTLDSILKRGIGNSSVNNVIKICNALNLSVDALAAGEIEYQFEKKSAHTNEIREIVNDTKARIISGGELTIDGRAIDIEYVEPIIDALDISYEMVKKKSGAKIVKQKP